MASRAEVIETTAGEVAAELARRGVKPGERITVTLEVQTAPQRPAGLAEIAARMRETAAARGLTTETFDKILAQRGRFVPRRIRGSAIATEE